MFYFQSVNTSDSTSFKQRQKEEKLKVEIARTKASGREVGSWQGQRQLESTKHRDLVYII